MVKETAKGRIIKLFVDGQWHSTSEIVAVGGISGMRRFQEVRRAIRLEKYPGLEEVEQRRLTDKKRLNQYEYRFVGDVICNDEKKIDAKVIQKGAVTEQRLKKKSDRKVDKESSCEEGYAACEVEKKSDKKLDRESLIVERKNELTELSDRSRYVPVRSLRREVG